MVRALGGDIGDSDFFDVRLGDEIVNCAVAHAAGAQNEYSHAGRMVIYPEMDAEEPVADVPVVPEESVVEEAPPAEIIVNEVVDPHAGRRLIVIKHHALVRLSHWLNVPILFG